MLTIIILMIIAIALGGIAAYNLYSITQTQNLLIQSQKNISTVSMWKTMIISKAKASGYNNEIILPYGINKSGYQTLPQWIYFNTKNPWGKDIIYCPFAPTSTGIPNAVVNMSNGSYQVEVKKDFTTVYGGDQRAYVKSSEKLKSSENIEYPSEILAFLISPIPSATLLPISCSGLTFNNNTQSYTSPSGLVETITRGDVETFANLSILAGQQDSPIQSAGVFNNTVSNDSATDGNTLINNFNYIFNSNNNYAYLKLDEGTHTLNANLLENENSTSNLNKKTLIIEGSEVGTTTVTSPDSLTFNIKDFNLYFKNVKFDSNLKFNLNNSSLKTENVEISNIDLKNSKYSIIGNTIVNSNSEISKNPIKMYNSELNIDPNIVLTINESNGNNASISASLSKILIDSNSTLNIYKNSGKKTISLNNSKLNLENSNINTYSSSSYNNDLYIDSLSNVSIFNSNFLTSGRALDSIFSNGHISIIGSSIINNQAGSRSVILLSENSSIYMTGIESINRNSIIGNSQVSRRSNHAIHDDSGARYASGKDGVILYAQNINNEATCAFGNLFLYSKESFNSGNTTENDYQIMNSLNTNDSRVLEEAVKSTSLLASKINSTNWSCIK